MADSFVSMFSADCGGRFHPLRGGGERGGEAAGDGQEDAVLKPDSMKVYPRAHRNSCPYRGGWTPSIKVWVMGKRGETHEEDKDWDTKEQACMYPGADACRLYRNPL